MTSDRHRLTILAKRARNDAADAMREIDMAAFDMLPKPIRDVIRSTAVKLDCVKVIQDYAKSPLPAQLFAERLRRRITTRQTKGEDR